MIDLKWIDEQLPSLTRGNWLYNVVCFLMGRRKKKLTYKEYMMLLYGLNRDALGEKKSKDRAINKVLELYKHHHNGNLPEMAEIEEDDEQ